MQEVDMSDTELVPAEHASKRNEYRLADIFTAVAVGVFLIVEVLGIHFLQWNGGNLAHLDAKQLLQIFVMGSLVYFAAFKLGLWVDSRR